jgi:hypothetical protein
MRFLLLLFLCIFSLEERRLKIFLRLFFGVRVLFWRGFEGLVFTLRLIALLRRLLHGELRGDKLV